ncbi:MAG: 2-oxoacid:acceptor oxidoreductase family protein [Burkholderiales bacterium]|nr:2-oxoacid:acceptor oxidoreductase family protein [Burkholderiales bacterium]
MMQEIMIVGRGGQGAQTAGNLLAQAFFAEGRYVQSFATYGGARRGGPVASSIRVDDKPVRLRCNIERASAVLCFDSSLLDAALLKVADPRTWIVVNTAKPKEAFKDLGDFRIVPVDGRDIAIRFGMGKVVNSALLGAFAGILGEPRLEILCDVIEQTAPRSKEQNLAACRYACDIARHVH